LSGGVFFATMVIPSPSAAPLRRRDADRQACSRPANANG
jgi:hypothetical protein